jgi:hypothetical protein
LRKNIVQYLRTHPLFHLSESLPYNITLWAYHNLKDIDRRVGNCNPDEAPERYCNIMEDATPYKCKYATVLEAFVFAEIISFNVVIQ